MNRSFGILTCCILIFSCSSSPEKAAVKPADVRDEAANMKPKTPEPVKLDLKQEAFPPEQDLDQAISSQNNELIRQQSIETLKSDPKNLKALNALAMYHFRKNHLEAALFLLNRALTTSSKSAEVYNNLGLVAQAKNEKREAIAMFKKSIDLKADNYAAAANAAAIYAQEQDFSKVIYLLEGYVAQGKSDIGGQNNYAIALTAGGKIKEAAETYESILKVSPNYKSAMHNYAILLVDKLGKFQEGLDLINRLKFVASDFGASPTIKELEIRAKAGLK